MAMAPQMSELTLGARMRLARHGARLNQTELARRLHISRDSLGDYEADRTDPPSRIIRGWAEETSTSADWLLFGGTRVYLQAKRPTLRGLPGGRAGQRERSPRPRSIHAVPSPKS